MKSQNYTHSLIGIILPMIAIILGIIILPGSTFAQDNNYKITSSFDGKYYIVSTPDGKIVNYQVNANQKAEQLTCTSVPENSEVNVQMENQNFFSNNEELQAVFSNQLYGQLNSVYKMELYLVYTTQPDFEISEIYFNDVLNRIKVKTDENVLVFKYDNEGNVSDVNKRARSKEYIAYKSNSRIDGDYLKTYDVIDKFVEGVATEDTFSFALK
jgi:hypothetical protein